MTDAGSPSLANPDYWWYQVRARLLEAALGQFVSPGSRILDLGSADGPSVAWLAERGPRVGVDPDPRGLRPGDVRGTAERLPFMTESFDVVSAFDVIEHCASEAAALDEARRVLVAGGTFLVSVPAYQWAWTRHDEWNAHYRRYTRSRLRASLELAGFEVLRASYMFCGTFPFFAADRLRSRWRERDRAGHQPADGGRQGGTVPLPQLSRPVEKIMTTVSELDRNLLPQVDLPFGSSVVCAAVKQR
jgi:SAM-dependent methyltransferase